MLSRIKVLVIILSLFFMAFTQVSFADWSVGVSVGDRDRHHDHWDRGWDHRWHDHPHWGYHEHFLPSGCYGVWAHGIKYYYCDGLYYNYVGAGDYVLVDPPMDAYVTTIPQDFQPEVINGTTYYNNDGIYYVLTPHGYRVVGAPVVMSQPAPVVVQTAPVAPVQDAYTINVPNNNGSYTPVVIRRAANGGYVGPQGEMYSTFPSVAQLKVMYGNK